MWAPFSKRLADSRIALLTSAGLYLKASQPSFDVDREQSQPDWVADDVAVAHLHINEDDLLADPEIALPMHLLGELVREGVVGGTVANHVAVMGYQDRALSDWHATTAPAIVSHLRDQGADALVLAPA